MGTIIRSWGMWGYLIILGSAFFALGCDVSTPKPLEPLTTLQEKPVTVVLLEFPDRPKISYRENDYRNLVFGSANDWFSKNSRGRFLLREENVLRFASPTSWSEIAAQKPADDTQGSWWIYTVAEIVRKRLAEQFRSPEHVLIFHNVVGEVGDFAAGVDVVISAEKQIPQSDGTKTISLPQVGLIVHELGHAVLRQPDRYKSEWGDFGGWDVMAASIGDNPASFGALSRVTAKWASWDQRIGGDVNHPTLVGSAQSIEKMDLFPRYFSRVDEWIQSKRQPLINVMERNRTDQDFFLIEFRQTWGVEAKVPLPAPEGLLLQEVFAEGGQANRVALHRDKNLTSKKSGEEWGCESGALNVLGECIWEFKKIKIREGHADWDAEWKVSSVWPRGASRKNGWSFPLPVGKSERAYLELRGPIDGEFKVVIGEREQLLRLNLEDGEPRVLAFDLDGTASALEVLGLSWQQVMFLHLAERTASNPLAEVVPAEVSIRPNFDWRTKVASLDMGERVLIGELNPNGAPFVALRFLFAYGAGPRVAERITITACEGESQENCEVLANRQIEVVENGISVLKPVFYWSAGKLVKHRLYVSRGAVAQQNQDVGTVAPLHILTSEQLKF